MPQKSDHTVHILEGKATLFRRLNTPHWHVRFKVNGRWLRTSTKAEKLLDAKSKAVDIVTDAWFREKNQLPIVNKRFKQNQAQAQTATPIVQPQPPTQTSTPVQQSSAVATGVQQANVDNATISSIAKPKPNMPQGSTLMARARGVLDDAK